MSTTRYLPHLRNAVPQQGYGNRLSMYLIALEAWRRGLNVTFFLEENNYNKMWIRYKISNGEVTHYFNSSLGDKNTKEAYEICENKDKYKKKLNKFNLPTPKGKRFYKNESAEKIINYSTTLNYPVVIKPTNENAGKGVYTNIQTREELLQFIHKVRIELKYDDIIIEEHFEGTEYRFLIIDGKVCGIVNRIPANIVGDGIHTIEQLIKLKNEVKRKNPNESKKQIRFDDEIKRNIEKLNYTLNSVPSDGEQIFLRTKSNVSTDGDAIDVMDEISEDFIFLAEEVAKSVDELPISGLDMIINKEANKATIIETNTTPMIGLHVFPHVGKPRDVVSSIVDFYFPETKNQPKSTLYFDFDTLIAPIKKYIRKEVKL